MVQRHWRSGNLKVWGTDHWSVTNQPSNCPTRFLDKCRIGISATMCTHSVFIPPWYIVHFDSEITESIWIMLTVVHNTSRWAAALGCTHTQRNTGKRQIQTDKNISQNDWNMQIQKFQCTEIKISSNQIMSVFRFSLFVVSSNDNSLVKRTYLLNKTENIEALLVGYNSPSKFESFWWSLDAL